jgi:hypothetical protein
MRVYEFSNIKESKNVRFNEKGMSWDVYNDEGELISSHPFKDKWNNGSENRAAKDSYARYKSAKAGREREARQAEIESKPLSDFEKEYVVRLQKEKDLYKAALNAHNNGDIESFNNYQSEYEKNHSRMKQLSNVCRKSVIMGIKTE